MAETTQSKSIDLFGSILNAGNKIIGTGIDIILDDWKSESEMKTIKLTQDYNLQLKQYDLEIAKIKSDLTLTESEKQQKIAEYQTKIKELETQKIIYFTIAGGIIIISGFVIYKLFFKRK